MRNIKISKFTLSPSTVIRSDPCYTINIIAFNTKTQKRTELNKTGYIVLKILENNSLTVKDLTYLLFKEITPPYLLAITDFITNMLDEGFVIISDKVARDVPDYQPKKFRDISIPITSTPYEVEMHLTSACNLKCVHCAYNSGEPLPDELKLENWRKVIDELEKLRVLKLIISGGEPFLFRHIRELLAYIVNRRMHIDILTNGSLIDADIARRLNSPNLAVTVSLDGASKETHDSFRGARCFNKVINGIQMLAMNGVTFHLSTVVHKKNIEEIEAMVKLALHYEAHSISFVLIDPIGRGKGAHGYLLSHEERNFIISKVKKISDRYKKEIPIGYLDPSIPSYSDLYMSELEDKIYCTAGTTRIAIRSDGCVFPCVYAFGNDDFCGGNINNENIEDIWFKNTWETFRGAISLYDLPHCRSCEYNKVCTLKLCRLRAYAISGDLYGVPPNCYRYLYIRDEP